MDFFMTILPYVIAIVVLYIVLKIVSLPFKVIIKFVINSILGGMAIFAINYWGASYGIFIGINIFTSIFVGITGVPGVLLLLILSYFI